MVIGSKLEERRDKVADAQKEKKVFFFVEKEKKIPNGSEMPLPNNTYICVHMCV